MMRVLLLAGATFGIGLFFGALVITGMKESTTCAVIPSATTVSDSTREASNECVRKVLGGDGWRLSRVDHLFSAESGAIVNLERPRIR